MNTFRLTGHLIAIITLTLRSGAALGVEIDEATRLIDLPKKTQIHLDASLGLTLPAGETIVSFDLDDRDFTGCTMWFKHPQNETTVLAGRLIVKNTYEYAFMGRRSVYFEVRSKEIPELHQLACGTTSGKSLLVQDLNRILQAKNPDEVRVTK